MGYDLYGLMAYGAQRVERDNCAFAQYKFPDLVQLKAWERRMRGTYSNETMHGFHFNEESLTVTF